MTTPYHSQYYAYELTRIYSSEKLARLSHSLSNAMVDLNPHQTDAALFAFRSPFSRGALLADEVGLAKTIEAGLILSQLWAERKRRILIILPDAIASEKKLAKVLKSERVDAAGSITATFVLKDLIDRAAEFNWVHDQVGAHFNDYGSQVPDAEVREFAQLTLALADALVCPICEQVPTKNKSGGFLECGGGCGKTHLYPVITHE
jgi:hypothetical protein